MASSLSSPATSRVREHRAGIDFGEPRAAGGSNARLTRFECRMTRTDREDCRNGSIRHSHPHGIRLPDVRRPRTRPLATEGGMVSIGSRCPPEGRARAAERVAAGPQAPGQRLTMMATLVPLGRLPQKCAGTAEFQRAEN